MDVSVDNEVIVNTNGTVEVAVGNAADAVVADDHALDITVTKKEYKIVGDEVYIAKLYEDAPQWMKDLVQLVVDNTMETESVTLRNDLIGQLNQFATSYVPLNQYTQSILDLSNADTSMHATLETLNSNFNDGIDTANSQIIDLQSTKASKTEVVTKVIETLAAQLATPTSELGATIGNLQQTIVDGDSANADSVTMLMSVLEGEVDARATAVEYLNTYVGINSSGTSTGTGILASIDILQKQNDGVIETTTGTYDVILNADVSPSTDDELVVTAEPYATWKAADVAAGNATQRSSHIGDVYIKYIDNGSGGKDYVGAYKFIKVAPDGNSPYSTDTDGFTWAWISDNDAQNAYIAALNAADLADSKRRVFVGLGATTTPAVPYDIGDLWLIDTARTVNGYSAKVGDILRCIENKGDVAVYEQNDWVLASSYATAVQAEANALELWKTNTYSTFVTNIQAQVDGKAETFYQAAVPTGRITSLNVAANTTLDKYVGDLWKNTYVGTISTYLGNSTEYIYTKTANGSNWNYGWTKMEVPDIVFDTIDTKKSIYSGNSIPVAIAPDIIEVNDMWITGSSPVFGYEKESIYVWNGTGWIKPLKYTDDSATVALQNGLTNGTVSINLANATINGTKSLSSYVAEEIDKEVVVFSGANYTAQTGMKTNDIFIEKTTTSGSSGVLVDVVNTYKYNGTAWVQISNNSNLTKLADLTDGKRTIYSGSALPDNNATNPLRVNDLFIPTSTFTVSTITYTLNEMYRYTGSLWQKATRYDEIKSALSLQIDSKIETTYGGANPPVANQINVPKDTRGGDYWYCDTTGSYVKGNIYKYVETINGSNYNYTWTLSSDISKGAFDLADKKRIVFGNAGNSVPTIAQGLALSDIWIPSSSSGIYISGKVYKCTSLSPVVFTEVDYTNDEVVNGIIDGSTPLDPSVITIGDTSTTFLEYVQSEIDKKVAIYSGETAPVAGQPIGVAINDIYLWFTTSSKVLANGTTQTYDVTRTYKYSGSAWVEITTNSNITALADLADGKRTVFSEGAVPAGAVERDIWIPSVDVNITTSGMCTVAGGTWNGTTCSITKYLKGEIYQYLASKWPLATKYSADIASVSSNLQTQLDGKVDTYYQATVPTGMLATNNGDYWYCTADVSTYKKGKVYKYVHATTLWVETADVSKYAFDLADGKASIFTSATLPNVYKINDLLIIHADNAVGTYAAGVVLTATATRTTGSFTVTEWAKKINDTEDLDAFISAIDPKVDTLQNQADGKIEYFFFTTYNQAGTVVAGSADEAAALVKVKAPWATTVAREQANGNVVYFKDSTHGYWYSSATDGWLALADTSMMQALKKAEDARTVADEKIAAYFALEQSTAPAAPGTVLDTISGKSILVPYYWYDTATSTLKTYSSGWAAVSLSAANNGDQLQAMVVNTVSNTIDYYLYEYNSSATPKWVVRTPTGYVANSTWGVNLATELGSGTTTWAAADSTLENSLHTEIGDEGARVESKFAYNSVLNINGTTYNSGFGLSNSAGTGIGSEFWIDASRFKFTNSAKTGSTAPFTIDASGTTPQITFNGKVSFSNVSGAPGGSGNLLYNSAPALGNELKGWQIDAYNTNIVPVLGTGFDPWRPSGGGSVYGGIPGAFTIGTLFDVLQTNKVPVVGGSWYDASAYISAHRCTSYVTIAWFDSNDTYINEIGGSQVATAGSGALINWGRTVLFAQAPANAAKAYFYVRSIVNGTDPYCFVAFAYLGKSVVAQTVHSDWSEGTSAGASSTDVVNDINAGNTTTIDGGKITTGSILSDKIAANISITSPVISGGVVSGTVINGGTINGVNINGSVIKASWIDYSSTGTLTNWAYYTPVTMPAQYATNFAHDSSTGALITDSNGFVRLPKVSKVTIGSFLYNVGATAGVYTLGNVSFAGYDLDVRSFDDYTTTSTRRLLNANTRIIFDSGNIPFLTVRSGSGDYGTDVGTCNATWRIGTDVFVYYGRFQNDSSKHIHTTRLSKNGVYLIDATANVTSDSLLKSVTYDGDIVSCGIATRIHAVGSFISVVILNATNDTVAYTGPNTNISIGECTAHGDSNRNAGIKVYVPTGTESY